MTTQDDPTRNIVHIPVDPCPNETFGSLHPRHRRGDRVGRGARSGLAGLQVMDLFLVLGVGVNFGMAWVLFSFEIFVQIVLSMSYGGLLALWVRRRIVQAK